ncbi:MAG: type I methionyl aminopeptidase [Candidatus Dormibacteraeota bacterium]|uniref:Methionine aminopeptidase n=1 Tax=Candidatus Dormiibacter inghamiae TaxID=3127013 RepID=A0A934N645_9BACT|nr:type I methionyl aminopeptidase [Candidatus Dormibacteraeota bacterium]MBJ7605483.1 type I methionyl aminopeptidase [Candidatus Dormibacteraeota bacterium]
MINYKTQNELGLMRQAGLALAAVVEDLKAAVQPGVRTREIDKLAQARIRSAGARPGFLGYHGYPNSICISINDEAVHGIPGPRKVVAGDIVSLDLGLVLDGFWADMGCTVPAGQASSEAQRLIRVTDECLQVALQHAQPGGRLGDISAAVQRHAEQNGFSVIRQFVGHGIGRQMHEAPQVPNFGRAGSGPELKPGMTLAIEPMVNQGAPEVYIKPDGWTVCTSDGLLSSYVEHTVAITAQGPQVLTALDAASSGRIAV